MKSLRLFNICGCSNLNSSFLLDIDDCLHNRSQILEIAINGTLLAKKFKMKPQSDSIKELLSRTKGKVKLSIDSFTRDGKLKKSPHEWYQWEGEEDYYSDFSDCFKMMKYILFFLKLYPLFEAFKLRHILCKISIHCEQRQKAFKESLFLRKS